MVNLQKKQNLPHWFNSLNGPNLLKRGKLQKMHKLAELVEFIKIKLN